MSNGFYNKPVSTTQRITERDRYQTMMAYFEICTPDDDGDDNKVSKDEAIKLFNQIKSFKNPRFRNNLYQRLEKYIGIMYNDGTKKWSADRLTESVW